MADAGRVVAEQDPAAWAGAIYELLQSLETRRALAQRGLERANKFSCSAVAAQFREFYRWVAEQPIAS
jgi:glycosyltransferase involved in cell wall biosynthesis